MAIYDGLVDFLQCFAPYFAKQSYRVRYRENEFAKGTITQMALRIFLLR
ncbi:hypothetical protein [Campylobacter troglodytis]|nr:hypothetical protein [Campylobacter troglodytis]